MNGAPEKKGKRSLLTVGNAFHGASGVTRTPDLLITNQLLYRLSYTSGFSD